MIGNRYRYVRKVSAIIFCSDVLYSCPMHDLPACVNAGDATSEDNERLERRHQSGRLESACVDRGSLSPRRWVFITTASGATTINGAMHTVTLPLPLSSFLLLFSFISSPSSFFLSTVLTPLRLRLRARASCVMRSRSLSRFSFSLFLSRVLCLGSLTKKVFAPVPLRYGLHMSYAN